MGQYAKNSENKIPMNMAKVIPSKAKLTVLRSARPNSGREKKSGVKKPKKSLCISPAGSLVVIDMSA